VSAEYRLVQHRDKWSLAYTDGERGRIRVALGTDDRGLAEARARSIWNARNAAPSERVADLWPAYVRDRLTEVVRKDRFKSIWTAMEPHFGHRLGKAITTDDCRAYAAVRKRAGKRPSTIKTELEALRACLRFHYGQAAPKLWTPPASPPRDRWLTPDQVNALLAATDAPHAKLFIVLAVTTGARMSAILDLTWDRVDMATGTIDFRPAGRHQTNKRRVVVPMNSRARVALEEAYEGRLTDHVIEYAGQPVANIKKAIGGAARRSGIECSPHVFRHTSGVWMAQANVPMQLIAQFLGHTSSRVTEHTYARYSPSFMVPASNALEF
jgi:integrase